MLGLIFSREENSNTKKVAEALGNYLLIFLVYLGSEFLLFPGLPDLDVLWKSFWIALISTATIYLSNEGIEWQKNRKV